MYSRHGNATQAERERLAELQGVLRDESSDLDAVTDTSQAGTEDAGVSVAVGSGGRSFLRTRGFLFAAFGATLAVGVAGGLAIAAAAPPEPLVGVVPPDSGTFTSESIVYYGDLDGVRVWSGERSDEVDLCVMALGPNGSGGTSCGGPWPKKLTVDLQEQVNGKMLTVSIDFSSDNPRPTVSTRSE